MFFIPGWLIALLTFPGVIVHEFGHKFFCDTLKVRVHEVKYFRLGNPAGYVVHDIPKEFYKTFFIDVGPFIINSIVAFSISYFIMISGINHIVFDGRSADSFTSGFSYFMLWLAVSVGMHSFPSSHDGKVLWSESVKHIKKGNIISIVGFPASIFIRVANWLSVLWFDLIYAGILLGLAGVLASL